MEETISSLPTMENHDASDLLAQLESLRRSFDELQSRSAASEETLAALRSRNLDLSRALEEVSEERDSLRCRVVEAEASYEEEKENSKERSALAIEVEIARARVSELLQEKDRIYEGLSESLSLICSAGHCLKRIDEIISEEKLQKCDGEKSNFVDKLENLVYESRRVANLGNAVEPKLLKYEEMRRKQKMDLEFRIVSLTEENKDIDSLLKIAIVEKEAAEKSLSKMKADADSNNGSIRQIAEIGLQKVGFGFVFGTKGGGDAQLSPLSSSNACTRFNSGEGEEEVVSLASTVETMLKNLRNEVTDSRSALEECRSEREYWKTLSVEQAQKIENAELITKDLEEIEKSLFQTVVKLKEKIKKGSKEVEELKVKINEGTKEVEELKFQIKEGSKDVARWRDACKLEIKAGQAAILGYENQHYLLREELKLTKSALEAANSKLCGKERITSTAMVAQAAAEQTLQLMDHQLAVSRDQIEELSKKLEEAERRGGWKRVRDICLPWQARRIAPNAGSSCLK